MKTIIVGAGALGGFVGALMADAGHDVTLYDIREDYVKLVQAEGLTISPAEAESKTYNPPIISSLDGIGPVDVVILGTKAYHTKVAIEGAKSLVGDDTLVCSFQNGYGNPEVIEEVIGKPERILAVTTAHNFLVESPTHIIYYRGMGGVDLGPMAGPVTDKMQELGEAFKSLNVPVKVHEQGQEVIWNKILWNAILNPTAAVTGMNVIQLVNTESVQPILKALCAEYFAVSEKMGVKMWLPPNFVDILVMGAKAAQKIQTAAPPKPSMLQDIEAGRATEIDYINAAIVAKGKEHGVPTPVNETLVGLVKALESKQAPAQQS